MEPDSNEAFEIGEGHEVLSPLQQVLRCDPSVSVRLGKNQDLDEGRRAARTGSGVLTPQFKVSEGCQFDLSESPFTTVVRPCFRDERKVEEVGIF